MKGPPCYGPAIARGAVLPAADKMDDFQPISIRQHDIFQCRARDNLQIPLHRDLCRIKADITDKIGYGGMRAKTAQITIQGEGDTIGGQIRGHFISHFLFTCI